MRGRSQPCSSTEPGGIVRRPGEGVVVDLSLSAEQELFRQTARDFVDDNVIPYSRDWDRSEAMDREIVKKLAAVGFLGLTIPEEYGGTPCDYASYVLVMEELG